MSNRMDAIHSLVKQFHNNYPKEGFLINPSISFVDNKDTKKGICVKAKHAIKEYDILLAIPESENITTKTIPGIDKETTILLTKLLKQLENKLSIIFHEIPTKATDHIIAFFMMHALSKRGSDSSSIFMKYASTLPSHLDMRDVSILYWTEEQLDIVGGKNSFMRTQLEITKIIAINVFQQAIFPILNALPKDIQKLFISSSVLSECCDYKTIEEYLWETYLYAYTIAGSRLYGQVADPHLIPLADLFNGTSEERSNVFLATKNWSVINSSESSRHHLDNNECNEIVCNTIYALRDIEVGEELFILCGPKSVYQFLFSYGNIPHDLFQSNKPEEIGLLIPRDMIPNDKRRILALEKSGPFQLEFLRKGEAAYVTRLMSEDYYINEEIYESDSVSSLRQFILLGSIASNEEIENYIKTSRLHYTSVSNERMCRALCKVIDYNITVLDPTASSSIKDYKRANNINISFLEKNALLLRICQRETLFMWRHHFCRRFKMISSSSDNNNDFDTPQSSIHNKLLQDDCCRICGRTYPIMKCTRCKGAIYCSRLHQVIDWKAGHKRTCRTRKEKE